jgi:hypothetical protein
MAKKKSSVATVFGILQIVFGSLGILSPILYFSGVQQALTSWQAGLGKAPGQPDLSQERIMAELVKRVPWYKTFEVSMESADLVLCLMMIVGGIGLLQMRRWAHRLTIAYALLSILYTAVVTTCMATITPAQMDVMMDLMKEGFKAGPGPGPGPGPGAAELEAMGSVMKVAAGVGVVCVGLLAIYPIIVLIFMLLPSVRAAFAGASLPDEPEDYDDRYREEDAHEPIDRYPPDEPTEPDEHFRPGER